MKICILLAILMFIQNGGTQNGKLSGKVVNGIQADIKEFPHAVFLTIKCKAHYGCGASILNQRILLSAAHCLRTCASKHNITAFFGHRIARKGVPRRVKQFKIHEKFDPKHLIHDIALLSLKKPATLNEVAKRVSIMPNPPYHEPALICGWGLVDEIEEKRTDALWYTEQTVITRMECEGVIGELARGTLCAEDDDGSYPARGDSGSPLVVRNYIQIGLVSFKRPDYSRSVIVYVMIERYLGWIEHNTKKLYCNAASGVKC